MKNLMNNLNLGMIDGTNEEFRRAIGILISISRTPFSKNYRINEMSNEISDEMRELMIKAGIATEGTHSRLYLTKDGKEYAERLLGLTYETMIFMRRKEITDNLEDILFYIQENEPFTKDDISYA